MPSARQPSARVLKKEAREASKRWCPSCDAIRATEWGECERCHAVLIAPPKIVDYRVAPTPNYPELPPGTMDRNALIVFLNSGMFRPRKQKVNVGDPTLPMGKMEVVPHSTECPLCKHATIEAIFRTERLPTCECRSVHPKGTVTCQYCGGDTTTKIELDLSCFVCAAQSIPNRRDMAGRLIVATTVPIIYLRNISGDQWLMTIEPLLPASNATEARDA